MAKMTTITRSNSRNLRSEIEDELADLAARYGLEVSVGGARFTSSNATFKLTLATTNEDGSTNTPEAENFRVLASRYGLKPEDLGAKFQFRNSTYEITGLNTRAPQYPIQAVNQNGKRYKFPADDVIRALGRSVEF